MSDGLLFGAAWGTLLLAPPLGVLAGFALRRGPAARVRYLYAAAGALLAGAAIVMASPWSLRGVAADAWLLMAAYAAYCAAAAAATLRLRPSRLRVLLGAVLAVPVALGLVLGTIGVLGLAFVVGDLEPRSDRALDRGLSYRTYGFGNATTASGGTVVQVYTHPRSAPFLERSLFRRPYNFREHDLERLTVHVERDASAGEVVVIREGGRVLDRIPRT